MHYREIITPSFAAGFAMNQSQAAFPELWDGLIGCWCPFVGPQVNLLLDFSGRKNHGVMTGFTNDAWVPGPRGWALAFAGASEKIICGTSLFRMTFPRSVIARVKVADTTHSTYSFYTATIGADGTKSYEFLMHRATVSGLCWQMDTGPGTALFSSPSANMVANKWTYVAMARNASGAATVIYQDSLQLDSRSFTNAFANDTGQVFCIGSQDGAGVVLNGAIDMLLLYDRQLRPGLINEISEGATPLHLAQHTIPALKTGLIPTVTTTAVTGATAYIAWSGGNVTNDGGDAVTARGVCWNTTGSPTIADPKTTNGTGIGAFTSMLYGLNPVTTYHVRAYATNGVGTAYGNEEDVTTMATTTYAIYRNNRLEIWVEGAEVARLDSPEINFLQGMRVGDGATNYAKFDTDGEMTLVGTARVEKENLIPLSGNAVGGNKPTETIDTNSLGYAYGIGDIGYFGLEMPDNWDSSSDFEILIHWYSTEAYATNSGEVRWAIKWSAVKENGTETITVNNTTTNGVDVNVPATAKTLVETSIAIPAASLEAHDVILFQVTRVALVGGNDPSAAKAPVIISLEAEYISNKLGIPT